MFEETEMWTGYPLKNVGEIIEEFQSRGLSLKTYSAAQLRRLEIDHFLLFEGNEK